MDDKRLPLVASTGNLDNAPTMVTRAALTLWCQYYLEGGWGWVVLGASVVSTLITFGCQWTIVDYLSRTTIADWKSSDVQKDVEAARLALIFLNVFLLYPFGWERDREQVFAFLLVFTSLCGGLIIVCVWRTLDLISTHFSRLHRLD